MFVNLAHRGASSYAPENTLAAFYKGLDMGASGIETDLCRTRDGVLILHHDDDLSRCTNGSGTVADHTWKELQKLDAGAWFGETYRGEPLVSFEQLLRFFGRKDIHLALELKDRGMESDVLNLLAESDVQATVTITSFHFEDLVAVRKLDDAVRIGFLFEKVDSEVVDSLKDIGATQACPATEWLTAEGVAFAKKAGFEVRAWGVKNERMMSHALACGVDGMTVNFPDKLARALVQTRTV